MRTVEDMGERVVDYSEQILKMLHDHAPDEGVDTAPFLCALCHVLGRLLALTAAADNRSLEPLVKLAVGTVRDSARMHDAERRSQMQ